jgi:drug/metabolite transporter (DMT)-like permease
LESLFAALFGALLGEERLAWVQYAGCGLMLAGILLAQWPELAASPLAKASDGEIPGPTGT